MEGEGLRAELQPCCPLMTCSGHVSGDVSQLKEEIVALKDQRQALSSNNKELSSKVEQLQLQRDT